LVGTGDGKTGGQLRIASQGAAVLGLDLGAALAIGMALGHDAYLLAELLPAGEAGLVKALNERLASSADPI
jgi:hypothetical protein